MGLPASIPRVARPDELAADPLAFLARARAAHGDLVVLREEGPLFSRAPDCRGVVAVFGAEGQRIVLGDLDRFGMPISAALQLGLPAPLVQLNRGLHSMTGEPHAAQRRLLGGILGAGIEAYDGDLRAALGEATAGWRAGATFGLLGAMRELATAVSSRLLFGAPGEARDHLVWLLRSYFHLRREVTSRAGAAGEGVLETLVALGLSLDEALRAHVRRCRGGGADAPRGLIADLAAARTETGALLDEDDVVAHANVLFISGTEPIAVSLTWILLLLARRPALRRRLRTELAADGGAGGRTLRDDVIAEVLRLVPPNALMVRVTTRETRLLDAALPERCEIVVCPFVGHRDPARFPEPGRFLPARWRTVKPSPFEYLPFGAGGHACIGKALARHLLDRALSHILSHYALTLAHDQEIDWRIHIMLMPSVDPVIAVRDPDDPGDRDGILAGPVAELFGRDEPDA